MWSSSRVQTQRGFRNITATVIRNPTALVDPPPGGRNATHVDDTAIKNFSLSEVVGRLRGPADTQVRLKIVHQRQALEFLVDPDLERPVDIPILRKMVRPPGAQLNVRMDAGKLMIESTPPWPVLDFDIDKPIAVRAISDTEFYVNGGDHTRIAFITDGSGKIAGAVLNPGPREIKGVRVD